MSEKLYLSGPMSGINGFNFELFDKCATALRKRNFVVISPHELTMNLKSKPGRHAYEDFMKNDIKALLECHSLVLLPGWLNSRGARFELNIADFLKMKVYHLDYSYNLSRSRRYGTQDVTA